MARNTARADKNGLSDSELRYMIYNMGLYWYWTIHKAGMPADKMKPSLSAEKMVWVKELHKHIPESELARMVELVAA